MDEGVEVDDKSSEASGERAERQAVPLHQADVGPVAESLPGAREHRLGDVQAHEAPAERSEMDAVLSPAADFWDVRVLLEIRPAEPLHDLQ